MHSIYEFPLTIRKKDIDINGHVNNAVYFKYMELAATSYSKSVGFTYDIFNEMGLGWVVKAHAIEYKRSIMLEDDVSIYTWPQEVVGTTYTRMYRFIRKKDKKVLAEAHSKWVPINLKSGRICKELPKHVVDKYPIADETTLKEYFANI
jgi:acyl-CoA thioester hydrolase